MAGTREGGLKSCKTIKKKYGEDFYHNLGVMGGSSGHTGGFVANPNLARYAGRLGGLAKARNAKKRKQIADSAK